MALRAPADPEIKICGAHACQAVARRRREDIRRIYISEALIPEFSELLRWAAQERLAYHVVDEVELEKITRSVHHGGVALIVRQPPPPTLGALLHRLRGEDPETPRLLLYLDNVQNPHNLGAIVRVAAHFDADGVLVASENTAMSTAMARTAEGGAEFVDVVPVALGQRPLLAARDAGFTLIATTSHGDRSIYSGQGMPARALIMLGSESHGLAPAVASLADLEVTIPGSGQVESLNVACAATALLSEHWRRYRESHGRAPLQVPGERAAAPREAAEHAPTGKPGRAKPSRGREDRPRGEERSRRPRADRSAGAPSNAGRGKPARGRDERSERGPERPRKARDGGPAEGERSERSGKPSRPARPAKGKAPGKPGKFGKSPGKPGASGKGKSSGKPGKFSKSGKPGKPGKPGKGKPSGKPGKGKPSGKPGKGRSAGKSGNSGGNSRSAR
jgi:TrmH RNA methyltransferase